MTQLFVDTLANEAGTGPTELTGQSAAKAWARHGGSSISESLNVSSLTDNGIGQFQINYTTSFSSSTYAVSGLPGDDPDCANHSVASRTTGSAENLYKAGYNGSLVDTNGDQIVFGTLA
jgi:hypothetical protein